MTSRPFDVELSLRQHGASLRQLAAELLRDPDAADDAVQEVWASALHRPPRHAGSPGGWLATALRNVARKLRRGERRRARREAVVARDGEVEDHAAVAAREELLHRLVAEVSALEAPFREVIWRRYFEGLAPREIAASSDVPVATVKSRLQRGLQQLREKLGEDGESGWRGALAVAFGLKEGAVPAGAAVTTATAWSGVLLMTAWTKTLAAVAFVAIAGVLFWSLRDPNVAPPSASEMASGGDAAASATSDRPSILTVDSTAGTKPERTEARPVVATASSLVASVRGRCVDERGNPLTACTIELHGLRSSRALREPELLPPWRDPPPQPTDADGRFSFEFSPHTTLIFRVDIDRPSFVAMSGDLPKVAEGAVVDLGDIVLVAGVMVTGTVIDEAGKVVANAQVSASRSRSQSMMHAESQRVVPRSNHQASTDDAGRFSLPVALAVGTYDLRVSRYEVVQPQTFPVETGTPVVDLAVVVHRPSDSPAISGRVVDDADRPVAGALVECEDFEGPSLERSDAEGKFTVRRRLASKSVSVHLSARHDGHEPMRSAGPLAWGTTDVVLRLQPSSGLVIRVTDASNAPVPNYGVRVLDRGLGGLMGNGKRARLSGPFENGTARIPDVQAGSWLVLVDFPAETKFGRLMEVVEVTVRGPNVVSLRAAAVAQRLLRVVHGDGSPAVGTRVQLCSLPGGEFGAATPVFREERWLLNLWKNGALVVFEGVTDAAGRVLLLGPGGRDLGLRVLGPGHVPLVLPKVPLDVQDELQVTVRRGARLVGQITPPEVMADLRRRAHLGPEDAFPVDRQPSVRLHGADNSMVPSAARNMEEGGTAQFAVGSDGAFDLTGLPAGAWQVGLVFWDVDGPGATNNGFAMGGVVLADGVTTRLDADLQSMLPGTLEGEVTVNGVPFANGAVTLQATHGTRTDGQPDVAWSNLETDAQGRFTHRGRAGDYSAIVTRPPLGPGATRLRALGTVTVVRDQTTRHTFAVLSGTLRLKLLDSHGAAAAGVEVRIVDEAEPLRRTAADGTTTSEIAAQNITLRVLPKRFQSQEALNKVWNETRTTGQSDPFAPHWLPLGAATITAGQTTTLELRLPPEWEK